MKPNSIQIKPVPTLVRQPDGYSCGPTAVKMALALHGIDLPIEELKPLFLTNPMTGTTHEGMIAGLTELAVPYTRTVNNPEPFEMLDSVLEQNRVFLMRTLISGCKHWVLIYAKYQGDYMVADPMGYFWLMSKEEATKVWGARDYDGFVIELDTTETVEFREITAEEVSEALRVGFYSFSEKLPTQSESEFRSAVKWSVSPDYKDCWIAVHRGCIIGGYFLGHNGIGMKEYEGLKGIQGVALFLLPEYRGMRIGNVLRNIPIKMVGVDYIWGMHLHALDNVKQWTKFGRKLIDSYGGIHTTLMDLREKV